MSEYAKRLFDQYRVAAEAGRSLLDKPEHTPEEKVQLERAFSDVAALKGEIDKISQFETLAAAGDSLREAAAPLVTAAREERRDPTDREMLKRGFEAVRGGGAFAFDSYITSNAHDASWSERALSGNVGTAFNNAFADFVVVYERQATPMLDPNIVTVLNRSTGEPLIIPRITADPSTGGTVTAEAGTINAGDATLSQVTITPYKYAWINLWSNELDQDNTIGLEQLIAKTTGRSLGLDIGAHLTTGTGSSQPKGFIAAGSNGGTATGTGSTYGTYFGGTDLISLQFKVTQQQRAIGSWQMSGTTLAQARSSRDTTGQLLWQPSYQLGQPENLLGRPVYQNDSMANGSAAKAVAFGDFSAYMVVRVNPMRVNLSTDYKYQTDQLALRTIERVGGDLPDVAAIYYLVNAAV